jgi:hypothetical protein
MNADSRVIDLLTRAELNAGVSRPIVQVNAGELPKLVRGAEHVLVKGESGIFQRGGQLVRIAQLREKTEFNGIRREAGSTIILPITKEYLTLTLARMADWVKFDARSRTMRPIDPPEKIAKSLLAIAGEWRFPVLTGLTSAPTLRADGSLLDAPGYDPVSGLYAAFEPGEFPSINPSPTQNDARDALAVLDDLFSECAFAEWEPEKHDSAEIAAKKSAHAAVAIAATITAVVRHALPTAPAFGISAHKQGSGKTTAARAIAHVCTGREPPVLALSDDEAELRKCLLGILIAGDACVLIDNVAKPVDSAALCAMLTNATYSDRVLGVNQKVTVPTSSTWLLTGNHLEFVGDLTSRVLLSVLDPEVEHPESRPFERDLSAYVAEHRGRLLAAALTVSLAYLAAGTPPAKAARSRFSEWDRLVRWPLLWLGAADPLDTQAELRAADPVRESLVAVLHAWSQRFGEQATTVATAIEAATGAGISENPLLLEALRAVAGDRNGDINARRLGRYLARNLRRIEDGKRLEGAGQDAMTSRRAFRVSLVSRVSANPTRENVSSSSKSGSNADNADNAVSALAESCVY